MPDASFTAWRVEAGSCVWVSKRARGSVYSADNGIKAHNAPAQGQLVRGWQHTCRPVSGCGRAAAGHQLAAAHWVAPPVSTGTVLDTAVRAGLLGAPTTGNLLTKCSQGAALGRDSSW